MEEVSVVDMDLSSWLLLRLGRVLGEKKTAQVGLGRGGCEDVVFYHLSLFEREEVQLQSRQRLRFPHCLQDTAVPPLEVYELG